METINVTVTEFVEKYYLHDSSIEKIDYDADKKILSLTIEFCFWWQPWYNKNEPKNGLIRVTFSDVSLFSYDDYAFDRLFADELDNEILDTDLEESQTLILGIYDHLPPEDTFYQLKINAADVDVAELERYNL